MAGMLSQSLMSLHQLATYGCLLSSCVIFYCMLSSMHAEGLFHSTAIERFKQIWYFMSCQALHHVNSRDHVRIQLVLLLVVAPDSHHKVTMNL